MSDDKNEMCMGSQHAKQITLTRVEKEILQNLRSKDGEIKNQNKAHCQFRCGQLNPRKACGYDFKNICHSFIADQNVKNMINHTQESMTSRFHYMQ